jgi:predicted Zn-dependent protease
VEKGKEDHIIASETKPAHTLKSAPENEVSSKKPEPTQTATGIHTLRKTTETFDSKQLSEAYDAFQRGDIKTAQRIYVQVLKTEPNNRDALLGLAGISLQQGHSEKAQYYYQRVLEFYPQDSHGQVGLVNALAQSAPEYSESQLKSLLKESPEASYIYFSLGNLYARQGRWAQAQQAYFSAYQYDVHHPDYAYNLAVSLDQINQPRLALSYYQKSLQLIKNSQVTYHFSPQATQQRIKTLTTYYQREIK